MDWLTADLYRGKRTVAVMARLGEVAKDSIEPTLLRIMSNDFIERLRIGLQRTLENEKEQSTGSSLLKVGAAAKNEEKSKVETVATPAVPEGANEKQEFFRIVREACAKPGISAESILCKDTTYYFNVSYSRPTFWFVRFFGDTKRKNITTLVPVEEAKLLAKGFEVEPAPEAFGSSRIYVADVAQTRGLKLLLARSLEILQAQKAGPDPDVAGAGK
jgi:hypothetical protein